MPSVDSLGSAPFALSAQQSTSSTVAGAGAGAEQTPVDATAAFYSSPSGGGGGRDRGSRLGVGGGGVGGGSRRDTAGITPGLAGIMSSSRMRVGSVSDRDGRYGGRGGGGRSGSNGRKPRPSTAGATVGRRDSSSSTGGTEVGRGRDEGNLLSSAERTAADSALRTAPSRERGLSSREVEGMVMVAADGGLLSLGSEGGRGDGVSVVNLDPEAPRTNKPTATGG